jgi:uncharacterized membrane protein HdeD (DUF308 family)
MTTQYDTDRTVNYAFLLGGITAFIFGIILLVRQDAAIGIVALLIGLWWLIQGAFLVFSVFIDREDMWWKLLIGLIGMSAGLVVLANPVQSGEFLGSALAVVLGILGVMGGIVSIIGGFRGGGLSAIVFGIFSGAIGLLLLFYPQGSFTTLVTIVAFILMVQGLAAIVLAVIAKPPSAATG